MAALKGIAPRNEMEGMLAAQMVSTHNAAMECLRRAMLEGQSFEGRDQNLKHAARLMGIYERQLAALDKHRGKGQQKITVEHVTVEAGGQAIVGTVETRGEGTANDTKEKHRDEPEAPMLADGTDAHVINQMSDAADNDPVKVGGKRRAEARPERKRIR